MSSNVSYLTTFLNLKHGTQSVCFVWLQDTFSERKWKGFGDQPAASAVDVSLNK